MWTQLNSNQKLKTLILHFASLSYFVGSSTMSVYFRHPNKFMNWGPGGRTVSFAWSWHQWWVTANLRLPGAPCFIKERTDIVDSSRHLLRRQLLWRNSTMLLKVLPGSQCLNYLLPLLFGMVVASDVLESFFTCGSYAIGLRACLCP